MELAEMMAVDMEQMNSNVSLSGEISVVISGSILLITDSVVSGFCDITFFRIEFITFR